jgi:hypothetical protein
VPRAARRFGITSIMIDDYDAAAAVIERLR